MRRRGLFSHPDRSDLQEELINLTPLIDVVFVVLIAFIIVAPLLEVDKVNLAQASKEVVKNKDLFHKSTINIYVKKDNTIWINKQIISKKQLPIILKNQKQKYPSNIPKLFHDEKAYFGTYQLVKNALENAGFEQVDVILKTR
jgi:biopolymer transport protein ExbD